MPEQEDNPVPPLPAADIRSTIKIEPPDEFPGHMIGRYKSLETIGEGGCGVVYVAEQTEPVRRRVALKLIKLGMDTRAVVARFEAERQALPLAEGRPREALQYLDAGLRCSGEGNVLQRAWLEGLRGAAWLALEDYIQAEPLITNSLPTLQKRFGDSHFRVQRAYRDLVRLYGAMNQPAKADAWKKRLAP